MSSIVERPLIKAGMVTSIWNPNPSYTEGYGRKTTVQTQSQNGMWYSLVGKQPYVWSPVPKFRERPLMYQLIYMLKTTHWATDITFFQIKSSTDELSPKIIHPACSKGGIHTQVIFFQRPSTWTLCKSDVEI